jgi:hypothetical protein
MRRLAHFPVRLRREPASTTAARPTKDAKGKPFPDFDAFCLAPEPHGLGKPPGLVKDIVEITHPGASPSTGGARN